MNKEEIISGLEFTIKMFLFDPSTGETITEPRNNMDKITIDACRGAIELLEQEPFMNKPCVSHQVCHEDKVKLIDKIRAEVINIADGKKSIKVRSVLRIIDKYKAERW